jgi:hypothetical protein
MINQMTTFKVRSNNTAKTYTISFPNGNQYKTLKLSTDEFKEMYYYTENDWKAYIKRNEMIILK